MTTFPFLDFDGPAVSSGVTLSQWRTGAVTSAANWVRKNQGSVSRWMSWLTEVRNRVIQEVWQTTIPAHLQPDVKYLVMGSGGRHEDLLGSDFDHAILLGPNLSVEQVHPYVENFVAQMHRIGFPLCKGFVLSTNPRWIGTQLDWQARIRGYFAFPDWENARYLFMLLDGRPLFPEDAGAWSEIQVRVRKGIAESAFICWEMAHLGIFRTVALDRFGRIKSARGEPKMTVNVKEGLLNPIIHSLRLLAVAHQCSGLSTLERLRELTASNVVQASFAENIEAALEYGWRLRLKHQIDHLQDEGWESDLVHVPDLDSLYCQQLTVHLTTAKELEKFTHRSFPKPR